MEKVYDLVEQFIDTFDLRKNRRILAFILYGSYVENENSDISDIDILMVLNGDSSYRIAKMFDGYHLDIHALSLKKVEDHVVYERANGNQYIESSLRRGRVLINHENTIEYLKSILTVHPRYLKRTVNLTSASLAVESAEDFLDSDNDDYKYYVALESLRRVIHVKLNVSTIPELKVYKLYTNEVIAKDQYLIKLPNQQFIELYLSAIQLKDFALRRDAIIKMLSYLIGMNIRDNAYIQDDLVDDNRMKHILISLNHLVITLEDNIIKHTPYEDALYFLTLDKLHNTMEAQGKSVPDEFNKVFDEALKLRHEDERIKYVEDLFHMVNKKYSLDYDDFVLML